MTIKVWNRTRGTLIADAVTVADTSAKRREGLLKKTGLPPGQGLLIIPCEAVHCFFMKFTIDVLFINKAKIVVKSKPSLRPWRIAGCMRAHSVLELPEGTIAASLTGLDDQLEFEKVA